MNYFYNQIFKKPNFVYEEFYKNGSAYECLIIPDNVGPECNSFHVTYRKIHRADLFNFILTSSPDGHWIPDNTKLIDPWLADHFGKIIINNF